MTKLLPLTMILLFFAFTVSANQSVHYPLTSYEVLVLESLPEELTLEMNLDEIVEVKHRSKLAEGKKRIYNNIVRILKPLLEAKEVSEATDLLTILQAVPLKDLLDDVLSSDKVSKASTGGSADFTLLVLPKGEQNKKDSADRDANNEFDFRKLYLESKASIIDIENSNLFFPVTSVDRVNQRFADGISQAYETHYIQRGAPTAAFFIGMMIHFHLENGNSSVNAQLVGGVPTNQTFPLPVSHAKVFMEEFRLPKTPDRSTLANGDFPGVILSMGYEPPENQGLEEAPLEDLIVEVSFGSLGQFSKMKWAAADALDEGSRNSTFSVAKWWWSGRFNVPHLFGVFSKSASENFVETDSGADIPITAAPSGWSWIDFFIRKFYDLQINVHELSLNLSQQKVNDARVTLELIRGWRLPIVEVPSVSAEVAASANEKLQPIRDRVQEVTDGAQLWGPQGIDAFQVIKEMLKTSNTEARP